MSRTSLPNLEPVEVDDNNEVEIPSDKIVIGDDPLGQIAVFIEQHIPENLQDKDRPLLYVSRRAEPRQTVLVSRQPGAMVDVAISIKQTRGIDQMKWVRP